MSKIHRWRKQALGYQAYLVHVSSHIESQRSSYSRLSNRSGWAREREGEGPRSEQRARTLRHVTAGGTTSGHRKCQKAQSFTALFFSPSIFFSPLPSFSLSLFSSLFIPEIDHNLATHRCTPRGICGKERQLHCSAYFIFVQSLIIWHSLSWQFHFICFWWYVKCCIHFRWKRFWICNKRPRK